MDGSSPGRVFDGVGGLSAGATSRLLGNYPARQRSQILDYLFKPDYGANLQILKVEIGGDTWSTDGDEPSHMRTPTQVNCNRGYEWSLMEQAKKLNPGIKLYGLAWGAPGWVGGGQQTVWTGQFIQYLLAWLGCARQHGLTINYLGGWNEVPTFPASWFVSLRQALDDTGYSAVKIVAPDGGWQAVAADMASDPAFKKAVAVIGVHYPCSATGCDTFPSSVLALDKPIWASEQGSADYNTGAPALAHDINDGYVDGRMTSTINWSLIWSAYAGLPFTGAGLMVADTPWSGNYTVGKSIWVMAHTAQFAEPGWRYLDTGSVPLDSGGSVVTLRSPSSGNWSSIAQTVGASAAQQVTYQVQGGLSTGPVHVWATNLNSSSSSQWFQHVADVQPQNGSFSLTLQPGYLYTMTTTTGQHKGSATPPPAAPWRLPYTENFNEYQPGVTPRYFSDLGGAFQTARCVAGGPSPQPGSKGTDMCLQQVITQQPVQWPGGPIHNYPVTVIGDPSSWKSYTTSVDALLQQPGYVELDGRAQTGAGLAGYHFRISNTGQWSLYTQEANGNDTTLASGAASFGIDTWHRLGLTAQGDQISVTLDGRTLASVPDSGHQAGQVALEVSPWDQAQFDNFSFRPLPVPSLGPVTLNPVSISAPSYSAELSTTVTNPGQSQATAVAAQLEVPQGWTASPVITPPASLASGQSAPLAWNVTAPASTTPGFYQAKVVLTYKEGGQSWTATPLITVGESIVPQSQMTATASTSQSGYPPSNAIDNDPNTLWSSEYSPVLPPAPQSITLNLGGSYNLSGLTYLPRQDSNLNGTITQYEVEVSSDGTDFTSVATGTWANDATLKTAQFSAANVEYVRLVAVGARNATAAEINVEGSPASS